MSNLLATIDDARRRDYRRMIVLSGAMHVCLVALFLIKPPSLGEASPLPAVISVVPVSAIPTAKVAEPAPAPPKPEEVAPPPPPPPPEMATTVLPKDPLKKPKPKRPEPVREVEPEPNKEPEQVDLDQLLNDLREEIPASPAPTPKPTQTAAVAGPSGPGVLVSAEEYLWIQRVIAHVKPNWTVAPGFRGQRIATSVRVTLTASGEVIDFEITRRSGNPWYDESVERAVHKSSPLPRPPRDGDWNITFDAGDLL